MRLIICVASGIYDSIGKSENLMFKLWHYLSIFINWNVVIYSCFELEIAGLILRWKYLVLHVVFFA